MITGEGFELFHQQIETPGATGLGAVDANTLSDSKIKGILLVRLIALIYYLPIIIFTSTVVTGVGSVNVDSKEDRT